MEDGPTGLVIGDFNGDGKKDILVANRNSASLTLLKGNGNGTFKAPKSIDVGSGPTSIALADFNGDGKKDVVVNAFFEDAIRVLLQA